MHIVHKKNEKLYCKLQCWTKIIRFCTTMYRKKLQNPLVLSKFFSYNDTDTENCANIVLRFQE